MLENINYRNVATSESTRTIYWKTPYLDGLTRKVLATVKCINNFIQPAHCVRLAFQTTKTRTFFQNKDRVPQNVLSNLVYQYKCDQCAGHTYTGETERHFYTRKTEHLLGKPEPSEVSLHEHPPKEDNFAIMIRTTYPKIGEAILYNTVPPNLRLNNNRPPFQLNVFTYEQID